MAYQKTAFIIEFHKRKTAVVELDKLLYSNK